MVYENAKKILDNMDKIPYPSLNNITPNPIYAQRLYNDFAGNDSELSTILQYIYEHINQEQDQLISKIMKDIAIVEMKHLDIIGNLIQKLGLPPYYINSDLKPWNADFIKYDTGNLRKTLEYNIHLEQEAIRGYKRAIMGTRNITIQKLFNRIILDERSHIEIFTKLLRENIK